MMHVEKSGYYHEIKVNVELSFEQILMFDYRVRVRAGWTKFRCLA
jgi:hypothetical protein